MGTLIAASSGGGADEKEQLVALEGQHVALAMTADASLNRRQTIRVGAGVAFAQVGIVGFDGQIELEALRLFGLPEAAPAVLYACPSVPVGTREFQAEVSWDLPSLASGATALADLTVTGSRQAALPGGSSIARPMAYQY